jgi:SAM-dependent methyltransferase
MAHREQREWCELVKYAHDEFFVGTSVLDIGSLDINGNNRYLFEQCNYTGIDIGEGKNVDVVCSGHLFKSDDLFDVVISTECFEHDEHWQQTLKNVINNLLKDGGLFLFSCAAPGRPEHGTKRTSPKDSPFTNDYYRNLSEADIRSVLNCDEIFSNYKFKTRIDFPQDLYFYGIKK